MQTKSIKYLEENFASTQVELTAADVAAIRTLVEANKPEGDRYHKPQMAATDSR